MLGGIGCGSGSREWKRWGGVTMRKGGVERVLVCWKVGMVVEVAVAMAVASVVSEVDGGIGCRWWVAVPGRRRLLHCFPRSLRPRSSRHRSFVPLHRSSRHRSSEPRLRFSRHRSPLPFRVYSLAQAQTHLQTQQHADMSTYSNRRHNLTH